MIDRVLVAGGERAGQLFHGIALVEELRRRRPKLDVLFVSAEDSFEATTLTRLGECFASVDVKPWAGAGVGELARGMVTLPRNALQALSVVRSFRPDLVIGLGGSVSRAVLASAAAMRVPTVLLERQVSAGLAHRLLDRSLGRTYLVDGERAAGGDPSGARALGQPVRRSIVDAAFTAASDPAGMEARSKTLLVLGGARGAAALNTTLPEALARAGVGSLPWLSIVHQSGAAMQAQVQRSYRERGLRAEVVPFIDDMAKVYLRSALVVARAGTACMAELCAIGRPAILVPDSCAASDPRARRAGELHRLGAALSLPAPALDAGVLAGHLRGLLTDRSRRAAMAEAARRAGQPEAAAAIVDDVWSWLGLGSTEEAAAEEAPLAEPAQSGDASATTESATPGGQRRPTPRRARVKPVELTIRAVRVPVT